MKKLLQGRHRKTRHTTDFKKGFDSASWRRRLVIEALETRRVLATNPLLVVTVADGTGPGTLAEMIQIANSQAGADKIVFAPEITSVRPSANMPWIGNDLIIDGENRVTVDGTGAPTHGIAINGSGVEIVNLTVNNFANGFAVFFLGATNGKVQNCRLGTDEAGVTAKANQVGVLVHDSANIVIGTDGDGVNDLNEGNLISGNWDWGVVLTYEKTSNVRVSGNRIGTTADGLTALPNYHGIAIWTGASNNFIGTNGDGHGDSLEGNLISGNTGHAIFIASVGTKHNTIAGNLIGTDITGNARLANRGWTAIHVEQGPTHTLIGTNGDNISDVTERNVISGNELHGIAVGASYTTIAGNYVGTNASGTAALGNLGLGIHMGTMSSNNVVGVNGDASAGESNERNVISGNGSLGLDVKGTLHRLSGNYIGTSADGMTSVANYRGVFLASEATKNVFGTNADGISDELERNIVSGNNGLGMVVLGEKTDDNVIAGNWFGLNATGNSALPNGEWANLFVLDGALRTRIGTNGDGVYDAAERNVFSGSPFHGLTLARGSSVVAGNYFGTNASGTAAVPNGSLGIEISAGASFNIIGTDADGSPGDAIEGNLISGSKYAGIRVAGTNTHSNRIAGNKIGTDVTGTQAIPNTWGVIFTEGAHDNVLGVTSTALESNLVSGNIAWGVTIEQTGTSFNRISGNRIGTTVDGLTSLPNANGVAIWTGASNNSIGTNGDGVSDVYERNVISGNNEHGIVINASNNKIAGNLIGTDRTGTVALPNLYDGVHILHSSSGNVIGVDGDGSLGEVDERNIISGNLGFGVSVRGQGNRVAGNHIGVDVVGETAIPNQQWAGLVVAEGANDNTIGTNGDGTSDSLERNVISGQNRGIVIIDSINNTIAGNLIGTNATGTEALANTLEGILVAVNSQNNIIGTDADGSPGDAIEGNLISGSKYAGIRVEGTNTHSNRIAGNKIGTDVTGTQAIPNSWGVVLAEGTHGNILGVSSSSVESNLISGSIHWGVWMEHAGTSENRISGNRIGTTLDGLASLPNEHGIGVYGGASNNIVGSNEDGLFDDAERNVISGNQYVGVYVAGAGTRNNVVSRNLIGTNASGTAAIGNKDLGLLIAEAGTTRIEKNVISGSGNAGVSVQSTTEEISLIGNIIGLDKLGKTVLANGGSGITVTGSTASVVIGGAQVGARNVISGNKQHGIAISGTGTSPVTVQGNHIGTDITGTIALGNLLDGITIMDSKEHMIGGYTPLARNVISGNKDEGISIVGVGSVRNTVVGNYVGTDSSGNSALGNTNSAVRIGGGAKFNTIGGVAEGGRNVLSGSTSALNGRGVFIRDVGTESNVVSGNFIGLNASGTAALGNKNSGVLISVGAKNNLIGGPTSQSRNIVSGNTLAGVAVEATGSTGNVIQNNWIGIDITGAQAVPNIEAGVGLVSGSSETSVLQNVISGNQKLGVVMTAFGNSSLGSHRNTVQGNIIGLGPDGETSIPNLGAGIELRSGSSENLIGGNDSTEGNLIANNQIGILDSTSAVANEFRWNRFFGNTNYAIDLAPSGSTPNDFGDVDGVPNAPVITSVQRNSTSLIVEGFARPGTRIDLYKTRNYSNGFGQGETFLTSLVEGSPQDLDAGTGTYDANTVGGVPIGSDDTNRFRFVLPLNALAAPVSSGEFVTSIAANPSSEFGNLAMVVSPIVISGTSGNDAFSVTQNNANSWTIRRGTTVLHNGPIPSGTEIQILAGDGTDTLTINGSSVADTFAINADSITLNSVVIRHTSIETRTANGLGQSDTFTINSSIQTVNGGDGADRFVIADSDLIVSLLEGGTGYDTLDYSNRNTPLTHNVGSNAATNITRFNAIESIVATSGTDELIGENLTTYWAITGENTVQITNVDFVGFENLTGGAGSDFFQLWNSNSKITGKILGGEGNDRLTAFNRENTWNLNAARGGSITDQVNLFENIELLVGGTQADTFLISPLAQFTSLDAGTGNDTADFSAYNATVNLNMATQSVSAVGRYTSVERFIGSTRQDSITAPNSANTWEINGASSGSVNALVFESFEVLRGGSGADQFTVGPSGTVPQIVAGSGADTLRAADVNNTWRITGSARGTLNTTTNFMDVEHLVGGIFDDSVEMTSAGRVTGSLTGGAGTNSLSYRTYTTAVSVNSTAGVATNIVSLASDFQILIGGSGADTLRSFAGVPSVLVGNAGNDVLIGSTARDILIGGGGSDTLRGGGDQDILIGGSTTHDSAPVALANLRAEWTSTRTYNERIGNLQGTSTTGSPMNNETYLRNTPTDTLLDDNAVDTLYGEDDLDWFIAKLGMDLLPDRIVDELIIDPTAS